MGGLEKMEAENISVKHFMRKSGSYWNTTLGVRNKRNPRPEDLRAPGEAAVETAKDEPAFHDVRGIYEWL